MKKKNDVDKINAARPLKIGDMVVTQISNYPGKIVKIEIKVPSFTSIYVTCTPYREYAVEIPIPMLDQPYFKKVIMVCIDSEIRKKE